MSYVKSQVVMLPSEKATNHCITKSMTSGKLFYNPTEKMARIHSVNEGAIIQHLYFTTDEEIKEGDKVLCDGRNYKNDKPIYSIQTVIKVKNGWIFTKENLDEGQNPDWCKKIIATTDESLGYYTEEREYGYDPRSKTGGWKPLPRPSKEFLKKYCELGGIDEVMVEYEYNHDSSVPYPKTIEGEPTKLKVAPDNTITISKVEEKTYTQKEVDDLLDRNTCEITAQVIKNKQMFSREDVTNLITKAIKNVLEGVVGLEHHSESISNQWIKENIK